MQYSCKDFLSKLCDLFAIGGRVSQDISIKQVDQSILIYYFVKERYIYISKNVYKGNGTNSSNKLN